MKEKIVISEADIAEANLELARNYLQKACASGNKEEIVKNALIARQSLNRSLQLFGVEN